MSHCGQGDSTHVCICPETQPFTHYPSTTSAQVRQSPSASMSAYIYIYIYTHIYMYVYIYICMYTCVYIYIYMYMHIMHNYMSLSLYIYIYIYIYMGALILKLRGVRLTFILLADGRVKEQVRATLLGVDCCLSSCVVCRCSSIHTSAYVCIHVCTYRII